MTLKATALVWDAKVRPKEKLVLLWCANAGQGGIYDGPTGHEECAKFVNASPERVKKAIARLILSEHLDVVPIIPEMGPHPRVRVKMAWEDWAK